MTLFLLILVWTTSFEVPAKPLKIAVEDYRAKVYASWLGQCVGNVYGLPHYVRERVWLANRAALGLMHYGYTPPATGSRLVNPHWFQIDPQLINEIWAVTAPGMVRYAAAKSAWAARIMDDGWGIEPTIHYGAMYSAAFFEGEVKKLIDIGTRALPANSRFAKTVKDMKELHRKYPNDWKAARAEMTRKYYVEEPADSKTIWNANLNGAAGILALLYGGGDFQNTLDLACVMGFDADNQGTTMSGLIGLIVGRKGIPEPGKEPFNKPHFVEYLLSFAPVETTAIRMTGEAGGAPYRRSGMIRFTSITELGVYGPIERNN